VYLEQLKQPGGFAGGGHHAQRTGGISQQLHAAVGQHVQEVDHVEAGDHCVGQLDERLRQQLSVHPRLPSRERGKIRQQGTPGCWQNPSIRAWGGAG
jgi:hypothetical protein